MKKCIFCGQESQDSAQYCSFCGKPFIKKNKWYHSNTSLIIGFLIGGPAILPMILSNPKFSKKKKIVLSTIVVVLTIIIVKVLISVYNKIYSIYDKSYEDLLKTLN